MSLNQLHYDLADRIMHMIKKDKISPGEWLNENSIAKALNVSRTPIRAAFSALEERGLVKRHLNKGLQLVALPEEIQEIRDDADIISDTLVRIAHERESGLLTENITESELMRRYDMLRPDVQKLLNRLADLDMMERKPGQGWRFLHQPRDFTAHDERYRFRIAIEPAALLEPTFLLNSVWAAEMRSRHIKFIQTSWQNKFAVDFYEMNAEFHEGLAEASGNRYIHSAIKKQNELRRLSNYDWVFGPQRAGVNSQEHLEILDKLEQGDNEMAALMMRRHLEKAATLRHS